MEACRLRNGRNGTTEYTDYTEYFYLNFWTDEIGIAGKIEDAEISGITGKTFTGNEIKQDPTIKLGIWTLKNGVDYELEYNNINAGTASVTINGIGDFYGSVKKEFVISPKDISVPAGTSLTYNGKQKTGIKAGTGYTVSGNTGTNAGTYTAKLTLDKSGNYVWDDGTAEVKSVSWKINPASISTAAVSGIADAVYTGKAITLRPVVKAGAVTLKSGTDYTVSYSNNTAVGTAMIKITGKGNYTGSVSKTFRITKAVVVPDNTSEDQKAAKAVSADTLKKLTDAETKITGLEKAKKEAEKAAAEKAKEEAEKAAEEKAKEEAEKAAAEKAKEEAENAVVKGKTYTVSQMKYKVTNADRKGKGTVTLTGTTKKKTKLTVPKTVKINGATYKVTAIGNKAFNKFTKLRTVTLGDSVKTNGTSTFAGNTMLSKVTIGKGVSKIGKSAFSGDKKLKTITVKSAKLKSVGKNAIKGIYKKAVLKVPKKQLKKYKNLFSKKTGFKTTMKIKK